MKNSPATVSHGGTSGLARQLAATSRTSTSRMTTFSSSARVVSTADRGLVARVTRSLPALALALAIAVVIIDARILVGGDTWDDIAYHTEVAPPRIAAAQAVVHGELPGWWDGTGFGVPLWAEPSHGAATPTCWLATGPRALDLLLVLHVLWLALGVALWARRAGASELGAIVGAVLVASTGVVASAAIRGALPAIAHLPWIGWAASSAAAATTRSARARAAVFAGAFIGAVALAGQLGVIVDAIAIACVFGARRDTGWTLGAGIAGGLAIGALLWIPAMLVHGAGAHVAGMPPARLLELVVPGSFGSRDAAHAVTAIAGGSAWAPILYRGAPLLALAAVPRLDRRVAGALAGFVLLSLIVGRGGWPAWLGAPELHLAAFAVIAGVQAARGLDAFVAGERRARIAMVGGVVVAIVALAAVVGLAGNARAFETIVIDTGLGLGCASAAILLFRTGARTRALPLVVALIVAPGIIVAHSVAPMTDRAIVDDEPAWAEAASAATPPRRMYRPARLPSDTSLDDTIATLAGTSAVRWGIASAATTDPARLPIEDRAWLAAAHGGGALLDRFGVELAVLPASMAQGQHFDVLGRRGAWALVRYPAAPAASVIGNWMWSRDEAATLARLFPSAGHGIGRGRIVLAGDGMPNEDAPMAPVPCTIDRWRAGAIDLTCRSEAAAYAVVSSTARAGWTAELDGAPAPWVAADVLRRAIAIPAGTHDVRWRYAPPGLALGLVIAALGLALFGATLWYGGSRR